MKKSLISFALLAVISTSSMVAQTLEQVVTNGNATSVAIEHSNSNGLLLKQNNLTSGSFNSIRIGQYGGSTQYLRFVPYATGTNTWDWNHTLFYDFTNTNWGVRGDFKLETGKIDIGSGFSGNANYNDITIGNATANVGIQLFAGTNAASGISFHNANITSTARTDFDGGIYFKHDTKELELWVNKERSVTVNASGDMGIGTATPSSRLEIHDKPELDGSDPVSLRISADRGSSSWTPNADVSGIDFYSNDGSGLGAGVRSSIKMFTDNAIGSRFGLKFLVDDGTAFEEALRIDPFGKIGIGTTSPNVKLHVKGDGSVHDIISADNGGISIKGGNSTTHALRFDDIGGIDRHLIYVDESNNVKIGNANFNDLYLSDQDVVLTNAKLGIGTSAPSSSLHIHGAGGGNSGYRVSNGFDNVRGYFQNDVNNSDYIITYTGTGGAEIEIQSDGDIMLAEEGNVGIGTSNTFGYRLAVNGTIGAKEVKVETTSAWPDFVFEEGYDLRTLREVEKHINENGHLPDVPSEAEVMEEGINVGEMNAKLLQKIEELTLYVIDLNKRVQELEKENSTLRNKK